MHYGTDVDSIIFKINSVEKIRTFHKIFEIFEETSKSCSIIKKLSYSQIIEY